jgi:hypothetical protein
LNLAAFGAESTAQNPEGAAPKESPAKVEKADKNEKIEKAEKTAEKLDAEPKRYGKAHPLLDPISFGPKLVIGLMIPGVGLEAKAWDWLGFAFDFSYIPQISISQYAFGGTSWDANLKFYPLRGAFFLGVNTGTQQIRASRSQSIAGVDVTLTGTNSIFFLSPTLGWEWVAHSGFLFGLEIGAQIGLNVTTSIGDNIDNPIIEASAPYLQLQSDITGYTNTVNTALKAYPLPIFALHIGYLF